MKKQKQAATAKAVAYELLSPSSEMGRPIYEQLYALIDEHHDALSKANVRIAIAWSLQWKPDADGRTKLGECKKASDLDRELAPYDFVILLNREFWLNGKVTKGMRAAVLDHEICHAAVAYDDNGEPKTDERGRTVFRVRKHDIEEFNDVIARHGCYRHEIEEFAAAIERAERGSGRWVGYTSLHDALKDAGVTVSVETIATWPESDRREVLTWALLRAGTEKMAGVTLLTPSMPACLVAVIQAEADRTNAGGAAAH